VGRHVVHFAVHAGVQPGLQAGFGVTEVDVGDADFGKAQLHAPALDAEGKFG
jgi:hypothetical protein